METLARTASSRIRGELGNPEIIHWADLLSAMRAVGLGAFFLLW
ncbi:hypothetical protein DSBG_0048 [Desulfosporosinus sp. BG]|nr:hypothetical protein DSBG_0048 [Desulfosporosinus sp. BG]